METELVMTKVAVAVILLLVALVFSIPMYMIAMRRSRFHTTIAFLNNFAGGTFLGVFLLYMVPAGFQEYDMYINFIDFQTELPLFEMIIGAGFFLVALIDCFVRPRSTGRVQRVLDRVRRELLVPRVAELSGRRASCSSAQLDTQRNGRYGSTASGTIRTAQSCSQLDRRSCTPVIREPVQFNDSERSGTPVPGAGPSIESSRIGVTSIDPECIPRMTITSLRGSVETIMSEMTNYEPDYRLATARPDSDKFRVTMLVLAMSLHTIIDGLEIGLQTDENEVWGMFAALTLHKSLVAFSLGIEVFHCWRSNICVSLIWLHFFALMSPIGITIGTVVIDNISEPAKLLGSTLVHGLSGGCVMYILFYEILCVYVGSSTHYTDVLYTLFAMAGFCANAITKALTKMV